MIFDFALGAWIRQGGRNAGRLATLRFGLTTGWWTIGALVAADPAAGPAPAGAAVAADSAGDAVLFVGGREYKPSQQPSPCGR